MTQSIYLDYSATTPILPEVFEAMAPYLRTHFGNAGSVHGFGRECRKAVDNAREQVAALINCPPRDIVFTSGGTEADNLALCGLAAAAGDVPRRMIISAVEHHAVLHAGEYLQRHEGIDLQIVPVDAAGLVDPEAVAERINDQTVLVSVMHVNNETGALQPIDRIAELCAERGVCFHTDAVQSVGKVPLDVQAVPVGLLALSGHKLYAPKGVGACYIGKDVRIVPQALGGAQERGRRAGTENVAGIVALGAACKVARRDLAQEALRVARLRDKLQQGLLCGIPDTYLNGPATTRAPHIANIGFRRVEGESIILALDTEGIAVSSGAACTSGALDPSHVLLAMGRSREEAQSAVRFSLGRLVTEGDIDRVLGILPPIIQRLRTQTDSV